jgi:hypothetical protein
MDERTDCAPSRPSERACGACSLCCTVLRVDELDKLAGTRCRHQRESDSGGCSIHASRPSICRAYRCLWLRGGLDEADRPDRLGAVIDLTTRGGAPTLEIREAVRGAVERSQRLRAIAQRFRESMPVRITDVEDVLDPDRPWRVLLPGGEENRVRGEWVEIHRDGARVETRRLGWLERIARRAQVAWRRRALRRMRES